MNPDKTKDLLLRNEDEQTRVVERPDGYYWQDKLSEEWHGPFASLSEATEDAQFGEDGEFEEGESLLEAEDEIGIASWVDPDTGELAEDTALHCNE